MHEKKDLDRIQDEAARIVTGATKLVSLMLLHNDVCWDLLQERRQKHNLIQSFRMKNIYAESTKHLLYHLTGTPTIYETPITFN